MKADESSTHQTLLSRLRRSPSDQAAWNDFAQRYGRKIYQWCRFWNLQEADAEDVTQTVLLEVARQMSTFVYDPAGSFRAWLKTIAHRAWIKLVEARQRPGVGSGDSATAAALLTLPAGDDLAKVLDEECHREMLEHAMGRVRLQVPLHVWEAFRLTAIENLAGEAVAAQLGIKVSYVYVARSKVQKLLRAEVERLDHGKD